MLWKNIVATAAALMLLVVLDGVIWLSYYAEQGNYFPILSGLALPFIVYSWFKESANNWQDWLFMGLGCVALAAMFYAIDCTIPKMFPVKNACEHGITTAFSTILLILPIPGCLGAAFRSWLITRLNSRSNKK